MPVAAILFLIALVAALTLTPVARRVALRLGVIDHAGCLPDGVFDVEGDGPARFVPISPPRDEELLAILDRIVRRTAKALVGYDDVASEDDALAALQAAAGWTARSLPSAWRPSSRGP